MCGDCGDCKFEVINGGIPLGEMHVISAGNSSDWHEIHITFEADQNERDLIERDINNLGGKIIDVVSYSMHEYLHTHTMTSYKFKGTYDEALEEGSKIQNIISSNKGKLLRTKIETTPWNNIEDFKNTYLESHIEIIDIADDTTLYNIAYENNGYISKNKTKDSVMLTIRRDIGLHSFNEKVDRIIEQLHGYEYTTGRKIIERTWYDDNRNLDAEWINT